MKIYSIQDTKSEGFNRPFFSQTRYTAMREIKLGLKNDESMAQFADDFKLWEIGDFDPASGTIDAKTPEVICSVNDLVDKEE